MTVVGREGELSAEALAALDPDLVIGYGNSDDPTRWTWWDEPMGKTVNNVAPFVGVKFSGASTPDVLNEYASLAEALGGDTDTVAAREDKEAFESGAERIRTAAAKVDDIEVLALNGDSSELYAGTTALAQFGYLKELGVKFTGPGGDKGVGRSQLGTGTGLSGGHRVPVRGSRQRHSRHHPCSSSCPR